MRLIACFELTIIVPALIFGVIFRDAIYDVPPLNEDVIQEMIAHPYETASDSFYFVDDELTMHNKARYQYVKED